MAGTHPQRAQKRQTPVALREEPARKRQQLGTGWEDLETAEGLN